MRAVVTIYVGKDQMRSRLGLVGTRNPTRKGLVTIEQPVAIDVFVLRQKGKQ